MLRRSRIAHRVFKGPQLKRVQPQYPVSALSFPGKQKLYASPQKQWREINTWFADTGEVDANIPTSLDESRYQRLLFLEEEGAGTRTQQQELGEDNDTLDTVATTKSSSIEAAEDEETTATTAAAKELTRLCKEYATMDVSGMVKIVKPQEINTGPSYELDDVKLKRRRVWFTLRSKICEFRHLLFRPNNGVPLGDKYELLVWIEAAQHAASWIRQVPYENRAITEYLPIQTRDELVLLLEDIRRGGRTQQQQQQQVNAFFLDWSDAGIERFVSVYSLATKYGVANLSAYLAALPSLSGGEERSIDAGTSSALPSSAAVAAIAASGGKKVVDGALQHSGIPGRSIANIDNGVAGVGAAGPSNSSTLVACVHEALLCRSNSNIDKGTGKQQPGSVVNNNNNFIRPRLAVSLAASLLRAAASSSSSSSARRHHSGASPFTFVDPISGDVTDPATRDALSFLCFSLASDCFETFDGNDMVVVLDLLTAIKHSNLPFFAKKNTREHVIKPQEQEEEEGQGRRVDGNGKLIVAADSAHVVAAAATAPALDVAHLSRVAMRRVRAVVYQLDGKGRDYVYSDYGEDIFVGGDLLRMGKENKAWSPHIVPNLDIHRQFAIGARKLSRSPSITTALQDCVQRLADVDTQTTLAVQSKPSNAHQGEQQKQQQGDAKQLTLQATANHHRKNTKAAADARSFTEDVILHALSAFRNSTGGGGTELQQQTSLPNLIAVQRTLCNAYCSTATTTPTALMTEPSQVAFQLFDCVDRAISIQSHAVASCDQLLTTLHYFALLQPLFGVPSQSLGKLEMAALRLLPSSASTGAQSATDAAATATTVAKVARELIRCGSCNFLVIDQCAGAAAAAHNLSSARQESHHHHHQARDQKSDAEQEPEGEFANACWSLVATVAPNPAFAAHGGGVALPLTTALFEKILADAESHFATTAAQHPRHRTLQEQQEKTHDIVKACWWYTCSSSSISASPPSTMMILRVASVFSRALLLLLEAAASAQHHPQVASSSSSFSFAFLKDAILASATIVNLLARNSSSSSSSQQQHEKGSGPNTGQTKRHPEHQLVGDISTAIVRIGSALLHEQHRQQQEQYVVSRSENPIEASLNFEQIVHVADALRHIARAQLLNLNNDDKNKKDNTNGGGTTAAATTEVAQNPPTATIGQQQLIEIVCEPFDACVASNLDVLHKEMLDELSRNKTRRGTAVPHGSLSGGERTTATTTTTTTGGHSNTDGDIDGGIDFDSVRALAVRLLLSHQAYLDASSRSSTSSSSSSTPPLSPLLKNVARFIITHAAIAHEQQQRQRQYVPKGEEGGEAAKGSTATPQEREQERGTEPPIDSVQRAFGSCPGLAEFAERCLADYFHRRDVEQGGMLS